MKTVVTLGAFSPARILAAGLALCIFIFGIVACGGGGGGGGSTATAPGGGGGGGGGTPTMFMYAFLPGASPSTTYSVTGYSVDTTTGALSAVPAASLATTSVPNGTCGTSGCQTNGGTYYPDSILYLASDADDTIRPFTLNLSTGALTEQTTATYTYTGFLTTTNGSGRAVQSHVPNVLYIDPSTAQTGGTFTVDAFSVNSSTGGLSALTGTSTVSSSSHVGVVTTPTYTVAASCGGTNCSSFTTYAINSDGSTGALQSTVTLTGNAFSLLSNGSTSFLLTTDGTSIYAYPISGSGVGTTPGITTNIGGLSGVLSASNCQSSPTSQSNVVMLSCSSSNNGTTPTYVQGFSINTSGVMTPGSGTFNYTNTYGNNLKFDNSGKYFFAQSGTTSTNTEYSVDASGNIGTVAGTIAGYIAMPPVGEFLYLQNNGTITPYQINSSNGSLTAGTAQTLPSSGSGNQKFLFGGSIVQSYIPLGN